MYLGSMNTESEIVNQIVAQHKTIKRFNVLKLNFRSTGTQVQLFFTGTAAP